MTRHTLVILPVLFLRITPDAYADTESALSAKHRSFASALDGKAPIHQLIGSLENALQQNDLQSLLTLFVSDLNSGELEQLPPEVVAQFSDRFADVRNSSLTTESASPGWLVIGFESFSLEADSNAIRGDVASTQESTIHLSYLLEKDSYLVAEPIVVTGYIQNRASESISFRMDSLWQLMIVDESNRILPYRGPFVTASYPVTYDQNGIPVDRRNTKIPPLSASPSISKDICGHFGMGEGIYDFYLPTGNYRLWNSYAESDTLSFSVVMASDSLCQEAMRTLVDALDHRREILGSYEKTYQFYHGYYDKFAETPYAQRALRALGSLYPAFTPGFTDSAYQEYVRALLLRFPGSALAHEAIPHLKPEFVPETQRDSLRGIIGKQVNRLPTERQRVAAQRMISELER